MTPLRNCFHRAWAFSFLLCVQAFSLSADVAQSAPEGSAVSPLPEAAQKTQLLEEMDVLERLEQSRLARKREVIDSLRPLTQGFPVLGIQGDTLLFIYAKIGSTKPAERAANISRRIKGLYEDDFLLVDSIHPVVAEYSIDIMYGETILLSISETDALWAGQPQLEMAHETIGLIQKDLKQARLDSSLYRILTRIGLLLVVVASVAGLFWLINRGFRRLVILLEHNKERWLKNLTYHNYTFLTAEQEFKAILFLFKPLRWSIYLTIVYITLPVVFSIFPFTRSWASLLLGWVWRPFKGIFFAIWDYLPNLFTILVIYLVMKYVIRFVKYIFHEIESEKLRVLGFHSDWAMPTYSIVRFLLLAFMFVLIFPYLPGSDSEIFKGVSVFLGILFSLGSSTAIANMVAGLVITYMRPFKLGDRIKIGDVFGDVEEKTLLVTRIKTPKNEVITIPNSAILSGNTINYSSETANEGLILHTTVTIGYDVPWQNMHQALIDAALRTPHILHHPKPFVFQTALEDFYVAYQINAYTKDVKIQGRIYSELHQNIQDVCNERGIEIMSPHYRAARDGNQTTIPANYLDPNYQAPGFKVVIPKDSQP
jgi:small-conductance mechanosensitive channel